MIEFEFLDYTLVHLQRNDQDERDSFRLDYRKTLGLV